MSDFYSEHQSQQWYHVDDPSPEYQDAPDAIIESFGDFRSKAQRHARRPTKSGLDVLKGMVLEMPEEERNRARFYVAQLLKNADFGEFVEYFKEDDWFAATRAAFQRKFFGGFSLEVATQAAADRITDWLYENIGETLNLTLKEVPFAAGPYIRSLAAEIVSYFGHLDDKLTNAQLTRKARKITNEFDRALDRIIGMVVTNAVSKTFALSEGTSDHGALLALHEGVSADDIVSLSTLVRPELAKHLEFQIEAVTGIEEARRVLNMISLQMSALGVSSILESNTPSFLYINRGDAYTTTVAYDVSRNAFYKTEPAVLSQLSESLVHRPQGFLPSMTTRLHEESELDRAFGDLRSAVNSMGGNNSMLGFTSSLPILNNHHWPGAKTSQGKAFLKNQVFPYVHGEMKRKGVYATEADQVLYSVSNEDPYGGDVKEFKSEILGASLLAAIKQIYAMPDSEMDPGEFDDYPYVVLDEYTAFGPVRQDMVDKAAIEVIGSIKDGVPSKASRAVHKYIDEKLVSALGRSFMRMIAITRPRLNTAKQLGAVIKRLAPRELEAVRVEVVDLLQPEFAKTGDTYDMFPKSVNTSALETSLIKLGSKLITKL